ncbi:signal peptide peptidase-like 2B isoform X3 [Anguilla rostrata]|uniref:signal peptide peptidase-like 2B isoform X3 n=1 Tax=Anguilla rostrata TaxID=7938 RepID=UPI0030D0284D
MRNAIVLIWGSLLIKQVLGEFGMAHFSNKGKGKGKDYCIYFNSQWARLPQDLNKASRLQVHDLTGSVLCSSSEVPEGGFTNRIPMVLRGNCTFYEKVRLAQINGARGLLIVSKDRLTPPAGNKTQYEEIDIPVALLSYTDMLDISKTFGMGGDVAMYAPKEPVLDYNMVIIFIMAVGTVAIGGYWAGSRDIKKRYMKHKRDDSTEKQDEETVDVTPIMICVFVVMCCSMLVLLYFFYDRLVYMIIGIFCLAASIGLYSCLCPFVRSIPFGKCRIPENNLPYCHKRPQVRMLMLSVFCVGVSVTWGVFRNEDQWAWVLQDGLGIAFCLYMLKTIRLPTFKACTLLLVVLFVYDVFFVFVTPHLTSHGESIMVQVAAGPPDSTTQEKLPMVLKVPRLNSSPMALCDRPFSLLGFGDILVPAYGIGLLITFVALALMQIGQPALLYLVPCTLLTSLAMALWRKELPMFWTGSGFVKDVPQSPVMTSIKSSSLKHSTGQRMIDCAQSPEQPDEQPGISCTQAPEQPFEQPEISCTQVPEQPFERPEISCTQAPEPPFEKPEISCSQAPEQPFEKPEISCTQAPEQPFEKPEISCTQAPEQPFEKPEISCTQAPEQPFEKPEISCTQSPEQPTNPEPQGAEATNQSEVPPQPQVEATPKEKASQPE